MFYSMEKTYPEANFTAYCYCSHDIAGLENTIPFPYCECGSCHPYFRILFGEQFWNRLNILFSILFYWRCYTGGLVSNISESNIHVQLTRPWTLKRMQKFDVMRPNSFCIYMPKNWRGSILSSTQIGQGNICLISS